MVDEKKNFFGTIRRTLENAILENNQTTVFSSMNDSFENTHRS